MIQRNTDETRTTLAVEMLEFYESTLVRILLMLVLIALEMARKDAVLTQKMMMKSMFSVDLLLETL